MNSETYESYVKALLKGNRKECISIVDQLLYESTELKDLYVYLIQRSMYEVGTLWENDEITIVEEHVASQITGEVLASISKRFLSVEPKNYSMLIACVQKEYHDIGARIIADYVAAKGWKAFFAGANIPCASLLKSIQKMNPSVIGLSNNFYINCVKLFDTIDRIKENFPEMPILFGGQAPARVHCQTISKYDDVFYISSLNELDKFIERWEIDRNRN